MGGGFVADENGANIPEWNIKWDIDSAKRLFDIARVPVFALPFETGMSIPSGKRLMERFGDKNPVTHAFFTFLKKIDQRPSWDPMAVLFALDLTEDMLDVKSAGKIIVDERGATYFEPCCNGNHYVLTVKAREGMRREEVEALAGEFIDNYAEALIEDFCR
jgi:inosine-uridine nucleoside N-ribohydrolase